MSPMPIALLAGAAAALTLPSRRVPLADLDGVVSVSTTDERGWLERYRLLWCALAAVGAAVFVGGASGLVAAPLVGGGCWLLISRSEPGADRRRHAVAARELPQIVRLLAIALEAGAAPTEALAVVAEAAATHASNVAGRLDGILARLRLGADPPDAWAMLAADPVLAPLGRALGRAHESGASVAVSVRRLADELTALDRAAAEERARAVGVKAAVPLGICLMPSFLLIGVVPLVGGLVSGLTW